MSRSVTIVMYHYVRNLECSRFPAIKGLSVERFCRQLDYIHNHYTPIGVEDLIEALSFSERELPSNAILLTFDDGYSDHFVNVFPLLDARGIRGAFFPSVEAILEHKVLDVNKIHFVLASGRNPDVLLDRLLQAVPEIAPEYPLQSKESYLKKLGGNHRYDCPEVAALKLLLQRELPEPIRRPVVQSLFAEYITADEAAFAGELYLSMDQIKCMRHHGMHIGGHGHTHGWLNHLSPEAQVFEVDQSLEFLSKLGVEKNEWTMCYPYGGYDDSLLQILSTRGCRLGFSAEARVADLNADGYLTLPRIDTNDLPS
jgi:peptidoglycan/xylan/chitin deacetylase (PgdA/CDA1 family)